MFDLAPSRELIRMMCANMQSMKNVLKWSLVYLMPLRQKKTKEIVLLVSEQPYAEPSNPFHLYGNFLIPLYKKDSPKKLNTTGTSYP